MCFGLSIALKTMYTTVLCATRNSPDVDNYVYDWMVLKVQLSTVAQKLSDSVLPMTDPEVVSTFRV